MRWLVIALVLSLGCQQEAEPDEGIAVGNPGLTSMSMAVTDAVSLTSAAGTLNRVRFAGAECGGVDLTSYVDLTLELALEPADFDFPGGTWCGLILDFTGPLVLTGTWDDGVGAGEVDLSLNLGSVSLGAVEETLEVDAGSELAFELAAPGWLDDALGSLADGETLSAEDPLLHDALVAAFADDSQLFDDGDGDGIVTEPERTVGPVATAMELRFESVGLYGESADSAAGLSSACDVGAGGSAGLPLFLLLAFRRSRRRRS